MEMVPVQSSSLKEVGYDPETKTLRVRFAGGGIYEYHDVPSEKHQELMAAESIGAHHARHIKQGGYKFTRLDNV